jgi:hypothetical protein
MRRPVAGRQPDATPIGTEPGQGPGSVASGPLGDGPGNRTDDRQVERMHK